MKPIYLTQTFTNQSTTVRTYSTVVPLDAYISPGNMIFTVNYQSGTVSALVGVQHTNDDIYAPGYDPNAGFWYDYNAAPFAPTVTLNTSTPSAEGAYAYVPRAVRFYALAGGAAGNFVLGFIVVQAGIGGT